MLIISILSTIKLLDRSAPAASLWVDDLTPQNGLPSARPNRIALRFMLQAVHAASEVIRQSCALWQGGVLALEHPVKLPDSGLHPSRRGSPARRVTIIKLIKFVPRFEYSPVKVAPKGVVVLELFALAGWMD